MSLTVNVMRPVRPRTFRQAVLALALLTVVTRLPALVHPKAIDDEAIYSVVANEILDGGRPYADAVERKPPLLFWTYAAVFAVAGKYNWAALHGCALVWTLATMTGLYYAGRELRDREAGLAAALLYSLFGNYATWKNLAFNGEMMMNLPLIWAWAITLPASQSRLRPKLFTAGVLLGIAVLFKQPAAIAAVPLGGYLLSPSYRRVREISLWQAMAQAGILVAGLATVLASVAAILARQGILREAYYWTVTDHSVPHVFWGRALRATSLFAVACAPLLLATAIAVRRGKTLLPGKPAEMSTLLLWLAVSALGVAAGGRFYPHYYLQLLPPLALLGGLAFPAFRDKGSSESPNWRGELWIKRWLGLTVGVFFVSQLVGLAGQRAPSAAAAFLARHTATTDWVFVWGQHPEIYLEARRRPASRFIATFPLTGYIFGGPVAGLKTADRIVPGSWDKLAQDFAAHPSTMIVDTEYAAGARFPISAFPWMARTIAASYEVVESASDGTIYERRQRGE